MTKNNLQIRGRYFNCFIMKSCLFSRVEQRTQSSLAVQRFSFFFFLCDFLCPSELWDLLHTRLVLFVWTPPLWPPVRPDPLTEQLLSGSTANNSGAKFQPVLKTFVIVLWKWLDLQEALNPSVHVNDYWQAFLISILTYCFRSGPQLHWLIH